MQAVSVNKAIYNWKNSQVDVKFLREECEIDTIIPLQIIIGSDRTYGYHAILKTPGR